MRIIQQTFTADPSVIDAVHDLFMRLDEAGALPLEEFSLEVMKLSVHEWVANLIQHADLPSVYSMIGVSIRSCFTPLIPYYFSPLPSYFYLYSNFFLL